MVHNKKKCKWLGRFFLSFNSFITNGYKNEDNLNLTPKIKADTQFEDLKQSNHVVLICAMFKFAHFIFWHFLSKLITPRKVPRSASAS